MQNFEIAQAFRELADLLEFKGNDFFKVRAYRRAAKIINGLDKPLVELYRQSELTRIPGIGKNIFAKIKELILTGKLGKLEELRAEIPSGVLEIMTLPGIGPKRASLLCGSLKVASLAELEKEARRARIRELPGLGVKTEQEIIRHIDLIRRRPDRILLGMAREFARVFKEYLEEIPQVKKIMITGSTRRWQETVGDIDILVMSKDPEKVLAHFVNHPMVKEILIQEENRGRLYTFWGVRIDLAVAPPEEFWATLLWSTGNFEHYGRLQGIAREKKMTLKKCGLQLDNGGFSYVGAEEDVYRDLGLVFIPPELRENRGEIEYCLQKGKLPDLIQLSDIKGDLHIHTNWSDGTHSLEQVIERAREKGYQYIAVTDHSPSLKIARGLSLEKLKEQRREIEKLNEKYNDIRIFSGMEVDILPQGDLDCPPDILEMLDVVIASVHTNFRQDGRTMTKRLLSAVKNKHVDIIGHLTGRLIGQREAYPLDVGKIMAEAREHGKILEINSSPDRLDLNEEHARLAKEYGLKMAINTDAHDLKRMDEISYGVFLARRAWLSAKDIINTKDLKDLCRFINS